MIYIHAFITALKVTWLIRIVLNSNSDNWSILSNINFSKFFFFALEMLIETFCYKTCLIPFGRMF